MNIVLVKVLKFGGSVLKNADDVKNIANVLKVHPNSKEQQIIIVVSAFFGITNKLIELLNATVNNKGYKTTLEEVKEFHFTIIHELRLNEAEASHIYDLFEELNYDIEDIANTGFIANEVYDKIISFGERLSSSIVFSYLSKNEDVAQIFPNEIIKTDDNFGCAHVDVEESDYLITNCISNVDAKIIICAGFIGSTDNGKITTLGRNGSDYSAALIASAVNADVLEIWKDIDGLYTADPKVVKDVKFIKQITYQEMSELSSLGNKILHTDAIAPCVSKNIPIVLKNFYNLQCKGTIVCNEKCKNFLINGIVKLDNVNVETISLNEFADIFDIASRIQKLLKTHEDSLITLSQNIKQKRICILAKSGSSEKIYNEINDFLSQNKNGISIIIGDTKSMITIIGADLINTCGLSGKIFNILEQNNINIDSIHDDFSPTRISFLCNVDEADNVVNLLHNELVR